MMKQNIEKITVSLPKDTLRIVDDNRKRLGFENRSELVGAALREYISQRLQEETGRPDERILPSDIKNMEDHLARLSFKIAVELAQLNLLMASAFMLENADIRNLRSKAIKLIKQTRGYIPLLIANQNQVDLVMETDLNTEYSEPDDIYETQVGDKVFSVTCKGDGVDEATMDKILRAIQYTVINSNERKESNTL